MNSYFIKVILLAVILFATTWCVDNFTNVDAIGLVAYGSLIFFFVFSIAAVMFSQNAIAQNNHRKFINALTGSMVGKVLLTALVVLILALVEKPKSILVIVPLFVYYVSFTILEVMEFLRLNKKVSSQKVG
jgi:hypothetical protein